MVDELCERLARTPFLAVFGPSGSGKSSVLRAGLLPAVWRGAVGDGESWATVLLTPGPRPVEALAIGLANSLDAFEPDAQTVARNVFPRLTALGDTTEDTRRRVTRAELLDGADRDGVTAVLDDLAAARLVVLGETSVEVAHEALIRSWPRLRQWLTEDREHLVAHRRLTDTAVDWDAHGRPGELLYRSGLLAVWENRETTGFNDLERDFLDASRRQVLAERAAGRRRMRWAITTLSLVVVVLTVLALVAMTQTRRAEDERTLAYARQLAASARAQFQLDPELGLLLAQQAFATAHTDETEALLRQAVLESRARGMVTSHDNKICGVSFSPDGDTLATSGGDGAIRLWRLDSEGLPHDPVALRAHEGDVWSPVFSPDGRLVAAGGVDGVVSVWDVSTRAPAVLLRGHERRVWSVAFSPDGQRVASVGDDGTVRVWPVHGGYPLVLSGRTDRTLGVTSSRTAGWPAAAATAPCGCGPERGDHTGRAGGTPGLGGGGRGRAERRRRTVARHRQHGRHRPRVEPRRPGFLARAGQPRRHRGRRRVQPRRNPGGQHGKRRRRTGVARETPGRAAHPAWTWGHGDRGGVQQGQPAARQRQRGRRGPVLGCHGDRRPSRAPRARRTGVAGRLGELAGGEHRRRRHGAVVEPGHSRAAGFAARAPEW